MLEEKSFLIRIQVFHYSFLMNEIKQKKGYYFKSNLEQFNQKYLS